MGLWEEGWDYTDARQRTKQLILHPKLSCRVEWRTIREPRIVSANLRTVEVLHCWRIITRHGAATWRPHTESCAYAQRREASTECGDPTLCCNSSDMFVASHDWQTIGALPIISSTHSLLSCRRIRVCPAQSHNSENDGKVKQAEQRARRG